jgi:ABC-type proline/glycine betaine transport system ATPase subunit
MRERINDILVTHTGQFVKRIQDNTERDYIMSPNQNKKYDIIDEIIFSMKTAGKSTIIVVTYDPAQAHRMGDQSLVMENGRIAPSNSSTPEPVSPGSSPWC